MHCRKRVQILLDTSGTGRRKYLLREQTIYLEIFEFDLGGMHRRVTVAITVILFRAPRRIRLFPGVTSRSAIVLQDFNRAILLVPFPVCTAYIRNWSSSCRKVTLTLSRFLSISASSHFGKITTYNKQ